MALSGAAQARPVASDAKRHHHGYYRHHRECVTARCADHADHLYNRKREQERRKREAREARAMSSLEACIIEHESGGDPNAVSGIYSGIGQWEQSRWESDGGLRFASTPLGATYAEQEIILRGEGEAGMIAQQGVYDGCA